MACPCRVPAIRQRPHLSQIGEIGKHGLPFPADHRCDTLGAHLEGGTAGPAKIRPAARFPQWPDRFMSPTIDHVPRFTRESGDQQIAG